MNASNKTYINILKSLAILTNEQNCWLIGSSCLILLAQNFCTTNYQKFNNDGFRQRDLDFVVTRNYDIIIKLSQIGTLRRKKHINAKYKSIMLQTRNINCISSYVFKLGCSHTLSGSIIKNMSNGIPIEFSIDIIEINTSTVKDSMLLWPVCETKRNFAVYCAKNELCYTELSNVSHCKNLTKKTICNMIETLKTNCHLHGSSEYSCTLSGDKVNRIPYSEDNELLQDDSILGKQRRLYDVLKGNSIELARYIDMPMYTYDELDKDKTETNCAVCLTELKGIKNKLIILKCDHIFCVGCIVPLWISYLIVRYNILNKVIYNDECDKNNNKCPLCREEIFEIKDTAVANLELGVNDYELNILNF